MARFPYYKRNVAALGKLIAQARVDPQVRRCLEQDPISALRKAGLPENVLQLMSFEVVDAKTENAVALPYRLNQKRLDAKDPTYLRSLAHQFS